MTQDPNIFLLAIKPTCNENIKDMILAPFLNTARKIYSLTLYNCWICLFLLMVLSTNVSTEVSDLWVLIVLKITEHNRKTRKFRAFSEWCSVSIWSQCSLNVNLRDCFWLTSVFVKRRNNEFWNAHKLNIPYILILIFKALGNPFLS